jgi:hypothetical protein
MIFVEYEQLAEETKLQVFNAFIAVLFKNNLPGTIEHMETCEECLSRAAARFEMFISTYDIHDLMN